MDELSRKFRSIDWKGLQKSARKVQASTASALKDMVMTDLENKTRAATADTAWGASGADMMSIAQGTFRREDYALIMSIVWQRLASTRWRCVYKALELLKFLIMHGAGRCAEESRAAAPHLRALTEYIATDEQGRDVGEGVRRRAALVSEMLENPDVLEAERAHSRELRAKLQGGGDTPGRIGGLSSDDYRYGSSASGVRTYGGSDFDREHYGAGGYGTSGGGDGGSTVKTTATFKGYGDDEDSGGGAMPANGNSSFGAKRADEQRFDGYDEEPKGQFAQHAKTAAAVDDLLGGAAPQHDLAGHGDDNADGDDEDFNPRGTVRGGAAGTGGGPPSAAGVEDLLADLSSVSVSASEGNGVAATTPAMSAIPNKPLSTSQLVQQLAAQREQSLMQVAVVGSHNEAEAPAGEVGIGRDGVLGTPGAGSGGDNWFPSDNVGGGGTANGSSGATSGGSGGDKKVLTRKAETEDPFADLLDTGKKSGVV